MPKSEISDLDEWQECRLTVGRFDGYLSDTRKVGFTLVTVLLTANALVTPGNIAVDRPAAAIVVLALLLALFMIDNYHWVMLKAAVGRAKVIEGRPDRISGVLTAQAQASWTTEVVLAFYGLFVIIAAGIPVIALVTSTPVAVGGIIIVLISVCVEAIAMAAVYILVEHPTTASARTVKMALRLSPIKGAVLSK